MRDCFGLCARNDSPLCAFPRILGGRLRRPPFCSPLLRRGEGGPGSRQACKEWNSTPLCVSPRVPGGRLRRPPFFSPLLRRGEGGPGSRQSCKEWNKTPLCVSTRVPGGRLRRPPFFSPLLRRGERRKELMQRRKGRREIKLKTGLLRARFRPGRPR